MHEEFQGYTDLYVVPSCFIRILSIHGNPCIFSEDARGELNVNG